MRPETIQGLENPPNPGRRIGVTEPRKVKLAIGVRPQVNGHFHNPRITQPER